MPIRVIAAAVMSMLAFGLGGVERAACQSLRDVLTEDIRISSDLTVSETLHEETTPLVESAVGAAAQASLLVNGNQAFEVVEAFTRKVDGRIVPADPKDFVTQDGAVGTEMSFVDVKLRQIPFRDLAVGDAAVLTVRITEKEHYIPGHYSRSMVHVPNAVRQTIDVTLRAPAALDIRQDARELAYEERREGDDVVRRWSGSIAEAANDEKNIADLDLLVPGLRFSTYPGYEAIANAYYDGMKAKAAVTPEVQHLAEEITRDKPDTRAQVEAMFDWVSRNIRYVAVYLGSGRYVPNDTSTILSRRFGDCKDDAVLLAALLAAKGIASEQVLLGADPVYRLPTTATLNAFNHVIVYIPALDLYVDPTVPFGSITRLPGSDAGKPVVRVSDKGATVARTPIPAIEDNVVDIDTRVTTTRDGGREGQTTIAARGEFSDLLRSFVARAEAGGKAAALQALAQRRGLTGTFDLDAPAWTETREPFRITTKWSTPKSAVAPGLRLPPAFSPILPHPDFFFGPFDARKRSYPAICRAGRIVHTLHLMLAGSVVNIKLPPPVKRNTPQFSFREEWSREGQYLKVRTEIVSSVAARACSPDEVQAVSTAYQTLQNRTTPVLYLARSGAGRDEPRPAAAGAREAQPAAPAARETRPAAATAAPEAPHPSLWQRLFGGPAAARAPGQAAR